MVRAEFAIRFAYLVLPVFELIIRSIPFQFIDAIFVLSGDMDTTEIGQMSTKSISLSGCIGIGMGFVCGCGCCCGSCSCCEWIRVVIVSSTGSS